MLLLSHYFGKCDVFKALNLMAGAKVFLQGVVDVPDILNQKSNYSTVVKTVKKVYGEI